jgi:hypothetical protein
MDAKGNIYMGHDVPGEDQARLDGYLRARAEADATAHAEMLAELEAQTRALQEQMDRMGGE